MVHQTNQQFVWLIIDDGSDDNTEHLVQHWCAESTFPIEYHRQPNQGKSMAHNRGALLTRTELFVCVDSDDYLNADAVESILVLWNKKRERNIVGILAYKGYGDGRSLTHIKDDACERSTLRNAYARHGLNGDTMLIFRTDIVSKFEFPQFDGENFVPEAYLYDQIDQMGELLILRKVLYYCQYLDDGYTKNIDRLLLSNPQGYLAYIRQRLELDETVRDKFLDSTRYVAMSIAAGKKNIIVKSRRRLFSIMAYPFGMLYYLYRFKRASMWSIVPRNT